MGMDVGEIPVDERVRSAAHWALYIAIALPTVAAMIAGVLLKVSGGSNRESFPGLLLWIVLIGVFQLVIALVGRTQYLSGVSMRAEEAPRPPETDPGIFHHG
jgi:hypothetical protein